MLSRPLLLFQIMTDMECPVGFAVVSQAPPQVSSQKSQQSLSCWQPVTWSPQHYFQWQCTATGRKKQLELKGISLGLRSTRLQPTGRASSSLTASATVGVS